MKEIIDARIELESRAVKLECYMSFKNAMGEQSPFEMYLPNIDPNCLLHKERNFKEDIFMNYGDGVEYINVLR